MHFNIDIILSLSMPLVSIDQNIIFKELGSSHNNALLTFTIPFFAYNKTS